MAVISSMRGHSPMAVSLVPYTLEGTQVHGSDPMTSPMRSQKPTAVTSSMRGHSPTALNPCHVPLRGHSPMAVAPLSPTTKGGSLHVPSEGTPP